MSKQKGFAVISGSSSVVAKIMENGQVAFGVNKPVNMSISGTLTVDLPGAGSGSVDGRVFQVNQNGVVTVDKLAASNVVVNPAVAGESDVQAVLSTLAANTSNNLSSAVSSLESLISTEVSNLLDGVGSSLDTLKELADAINNDPSFFSTIASDIDALSVDLSAEISSRVTGDASLSTALATEVSDRASADASLSTALATEVSDRASADASLSTGLATEVSDRASADASLSTGLATEVSDRASADASLSTALATEVSDRASADASLSTALATEVSDRASADASLSTALANEVSDRASGDASLSTALANEVSDRASAVASLSTAAETYTDQAIADLVDNAPELLDTLNELAAALGDDPNFATSVLSTIASYSTATSTAVSAEVSNRVSGDASLSTALATEVSDRASGDASLSTALATEVSDRASADASLSTALATEVSDRASADASLSTALATEVSDRASADAVLSTRLDNFSVSSVVNETSVSKDGDVFTVGLASDVSIANSLTVGGVGSFKGVDNVLDAAVSADAALLSTMAAAPATYNGRFFYLKAANHAAAQAVGFDQANKWYFCEGDEWFPSPFFGE